MRSKMDSARGLFSPPSWSNHSLSSYCEQKMVDAWRRRLWMSSAILRRSCCFLSSRFPHFRRRNSPSSSWENPHFQRALSGSRFHYCILPHEGVFHPVAPAAGHQEVAVVGQPVNHGGCHLFIGKDAAPFRKLQVRCQDEALALVAV